MAAKISTYRTYGEKLVSLFARLLFSQESHSLTDLARLLGCSKQTVLRLIDDIRRAYSVDIEETIRERRKYFRLKKRSLGGPTVPLTAEELTTLQMCRAFTAHLLGPELAREALRGIEKSAALSPAGRKEFLEPFAVLPFGAIDYRAHAETIRRLRQAMEEHRVCRVSYRPAYEGVVKEYRIEPLKIFSFRDCLYLAARRVGSPGARAGRPAYDPLLAIHRMQKIELTDARFRPPRDFDFESLYRDGFGILRGNPVRIEVEFRGWAAKYVSERIWSKDQRIRSCSRDAVRLSLTAGSVAETIAWLLSFGDCFTLKKPRRIRARVMAAARRIIANHQEDLSGR